MPTLSDVRVAADLTLRLRFDRYDADAALSLRELDEILKSLRTLLRLLAVAVVPTAEWPPDPHPPFPGYRDWNANVLEIGYASPLRLRVSTAGPVALLAYWILRNPERVGAWLPTAVRSAQEAWKSADRLERQDEMRNLAPQLGPRTTGVDGRPLEDRYADLVSSVADDIWRGDPGDVEIEEYDSDPPDIR
ncbi:hypothetical protein ACIA58_20405 [Kribbella sp. NPDC051586]|uniref:hypothetical protein n=1 Tax=Kribbella sp. NPDC051586 TaxID=3364118 RepID=UPI0037B2DB5D